MSDIDQPEGTAGSVQVSGGSVSGVEGCLPANPIFDRIAEQYAELVLIRWEGHDHCIVGVGRTVSGEMLIYDHEMLVTHLEERDGMTTEEATEYIDYNLIGGYLGPSTPIVMNKIYDN